MQSSDGTHVRPVTCHIPKQQWGVSQTPRMASKGQQDEPRLHICEYHDFETTEEHEATRHEAQSHPKWCSKGIVSSCIEMAAYTYFDGQYGRPLCAGHAAEFWERGDPDSIFCNRVKRVERPANIGAVRLETSHPVERAVREHADG